jgi:hypothetical protein
VIWISAVWVSEVFLDVLLHKFGGFGFALAAYGAYFGAFLEFVEGAGSFEDGFFDFVVGDAHTLADDAGLFFDDFAGQAVAFVVVVDGVESVALTVSQGGTGRGG